MIEFCDLKLCEECNEEFSSTYMHNEMLCKFCWKNLKEEIIYENHEKQWKGGDVNLKDNYNFIICYQCSKVNKIFWKLWCRDCKPFIIKEKEKFNCEWCKDPEYHKHKFLKE